MTLTALINLVLKKENNLSLAFDSIYKDVFILVMLNVSIVMVDLSD